MSPDFATMLRKIHAELSEAYMPGAHQWADDTFDGAWSKAMDRFDQALTIVIERKDYQLAKLEGDLYKSTLIDLIRKFKKHKQMDDASEFLAALGRRK